MVKFSKTATKIVAACGILLLILDPKTALNGATKGINQCIESLIPSLFPFLIASEFFCKVFSSTNLKFLSPFVKFTKMPVGSQPILFMGLLGGYPIGAKTISDTQKDGNMSHEAAIRAIGFCNNAGPAFIFGVLGSKFQNPLIPWLILFVVILSALCTGRLLPAQPAVYKARATNTSYNITTIVRNAINAITSICGWVIVFSVIIAFLRQWFLWRLPTSLEIITIGMLELCTGCLELNRIGSEPIRFIVISGLLSFGGLCVYLQTSSVSRNVDLKIYLPSKILQSLISVVLSFALTPLIFKYQILSTPLVTYCVIIITISLIVFLIKSSSIFGRTTV